MIHYPVYVERCEHVLLASVIREQYKEKCYSTHHTDASTLHSDEGRSQLR